MATCLRSFAFPSLICATVAAQTPAPNPAPVAGGWSYRASEFSPQPVGYAFFPPGEAGGWIVLRSSADTLSVKAIRLSGDSVVLVIAEDRDAIEGSLRGDTITGYRIINGKRRAPVWLVRRVTVPSLIGPHRVSPGPVSEPAFDVVVDTAVPMRTRDGLVLMSYLARPAGAGPFPVVLLRTPYGRMRTQQGRYWASRGYIFVAQDVRGRFGSAGVFDPLLHERSDGYDAVEWAAALSGSSGRVGMIGGSYEALTQWFAAIAVPPHLMAIVPVAAPASPHFSGPLGLALAQWACLVSGTTNHDVTRFDFATANRTLPVVSIPARAGCAPGAFWSEWLRHQAMDSYWRERSYRPELARVRAPVLHVAGWYDDPFDGGATANFTALARVAGAPPQRLVIGPWTHGMNPRDVSGELGESAWVDLDHLALRWLDRWLKRVVNGVEREPPVSLFVMGDHVWRDEHEWPLARVRATRFFLHSGGEANSAGGDGTLDTIPPGAEPADTFTYDPGNPAPSLPTPPANPDYADVHAGRRDVLVYTSAPLKRDLEVTGSLAVTLWAATDALDTDWFAMLLDVYTDGRAERVQEEIVQARYRSGSRPILAKRGVPTRYALNLRQTSRVFRAGHRLRVAIASAAFPEYTRSLNTGGDDWHDSSYVSAHQRVLHDGRHASFVTLPVSRRP